MLIASRLLLIYGFFVLPCVFSSTLIFPEFFSPFRAPLFLVSIITSVPFLYRVPIRIKNVVALLVILLLLAVILSGFWVEERQFAVNIRQWLVYSAIFMCGLVGALVARLAGTLRVRFEEQLLVVFSILFLYGIYTYYAQVYDLPEVLQFLRPNPGLGDDEIYTQIFSGWTSPYRAYSVWFEPSFSAMVLACSLPLLYLPARSWVKICLLILAILFIYLTFSRSAWLVGAFFILAHISGLFKLRLDGLWLFIIAILMGTIILVLQVLVTTSNDDISALIRIASIVEGMGEWLGNPWLGTGQAELVNPISSLEDATHIHASVPMMLHWYGLIGLLITLIPYWYLAVGSDNAKSGVIVSFVYLSVIAITAGGSLMMMSIFWFFWGYYLTVAKQSGGHV